MADIVKTFTATIYCGLRKGYTEDSHSPKAARAICRQYVDEVGLCVTVTPTRFVYVGGTEEGVAVGLIQYPRFPTPEHTLREHALTLAEKLMEGLQQNRVSVVFPDDTIMLTNERSRNEEDEAPEAQEKSEAEEAEEDVAGRVL